MHDGVRVVRLSEAGHVLAAEELEVGVRRAPTNMLVDHAHVLVAVWPAGSDAFEDYAFADEYNVCFLY